jgi:hypothetical protein
MVAIIIIAVMLAGCTELNNRFYAENMVGPVTDELVFSGTVESIEDFDSYVIILRGDNFESGNGYTVKVNGEFVNFYAGHPPGFNSRTILIADQNHGRNLTVNHTYEWAAKKYHYDYWHLISVKEIT